MSFEDFLASYHDACARGDADAILRCVADDYEGEYVYPAGNRRRFDREALAEGWRAAQDSFAVHGARWAYETVAMGQRERERIVASWVSFLVEGQPTGYSFLVETFAPRGAEWKLTHEHMEHRVEPKRMETG